MTNLTLTDTTLKLGELNLDKSQFNLPKKVVILNARMSYRYHEVNGEQVKSDDLSKIVCTVQDADKVKALKEMNIAIEELKAITLEVHDNLDKVAKSAENDGLLGKTVEPIAPQVHLMWNMARGNWSGVKLIASDLKIMGD